MSDHAETSQGLSLPVLASLAGAGVALLGFGLFLWATRGAAIFTDLVSSAIAWCF